MASSRETDGHLEATSKARAREAMAKEEVHPTRRNNSSTRTRRKRTLLQLNETRSFQKQSQRSPYMSLVVRYKTRSFQDHHLKKQVHLTLLLVMQFIVN